MGKVLKPHYCSSLKSLLEQILFGQPVVALACIYRGKITESSNKPIYTLTEFDVKYLNHLLNQLQEETAGLGKETK